MDSTIDLSIIFINYNAAALTDQAVQSVLGTVCRTRIEIIVVENGEDLAEEYQPTDPRVLVLRKVPNNGFGHACNRGAEEARGQYLLFLNNDTIVHTNTIDESMAYMYAHPNVGALGVQMFLPNGQLDHGCKRGFPTPIASFCYFTKLDRVFPSSKIIGAYRQGFVPQDAVAEVDAVSGAFLLVPHSVFNQIDGFDEAFFMYGEDIDLCYRIKQLEYKIIYYGLVSMVHLKGQSGLYTRNKKVLDDFYSSMVIFYNKHYQQKYRKTVSFLVKTAIGLKYRMAVRALQKGNNG